VHQAAKWSFLKNRLPRLPWRILRQLCADTTRVIKPAPHKPDPASWKNEALTASWLGHSTVFINFYGINILTDPVFGARVGLRAGPFTIGPKRYVEPALATGELPRIDVILLSHAHMDHFDLPSLKKMNREATVITAKSTADLLDGIGFKKIIELDWGGSTEIGTAAGVLKITAFQVRHWGARMQHDDHRGFNGYLLSRNDRTICVTGDTAFTPLFEKLRTGKPIDLMLAPIGAYHPWITSHCSPEEAVEMANMAGAKYIMPIHHQTFKLSWEPMSEPIERFQKALTEEPGRIALTKIGQTFVLPG
jgi:L-ascorbate metabolism protein UlaG (beta-lactamase superfamily)